MKYRIYLVFVSCLCSVLFNDSKRLFKIVMGTDLVTNKQIMPYKTTQGYRYLFKKDFLQQVP